MIYLLRNGMMYGYKKLLKIGYSDENNNNNRISQYIYHNPQTVIISSRLGTEKEELKIHLYLKHLGLKYKSFDEWFLDDPQVYTIFHYDISKIDRYLIKHYREILKIVEFEVVKTKKSLVREIFKELLPSHPNKIIDEIDNILYFKADPGDIDLDEFIWERRENYFKFYDLKNPESWKKKLFEELTKKFRDKSGLPPRRIDVFYLKSLSDDNDLLNIEDNSLLGFIKKFNDTGFFQKKR